MHTSNKIILATAALASVLAPVNGYTLKLYTDTGCSQGEVDFSQPDVVGGQGTTGPCTNVGFQARSIYFANDDSSNEDEQQFSGWIYGGNCVSTEAGQNDADSTIYSIDNTCTDFDNGAYTSGGEGIGGFMVGTVG